MFQLTIYKVCLVKMNNFIYKIILLFALLNSPLFAFSQKATRQQMDIIKRDKNYLTSTETRAETESEAIGEALKKLSYAIKKYMGDSIYLRNSSNHVDLKEKEERLILQEDGFYCVLIYVPKSAILELSGKKTSTPEKITAHNNTVSPTVSSTSVEKQSTSITISNNTEWASELTEWQREVIEDLLLSGNLNIAMSKLQQMKNNFKVKRWGAGKSCPNEAKAYWIVFDDNQNLVTILGQGSNMRRDFRTGELSSLERYNNMYAIWFNLSK